MGKEPLAVTRTLLTLRAETRAEGRPTRARGIAGEKRPPPVSFRRSAKAIHSLGLSPHGARDGQPLAGRRHPRCSVLPSNCRESREGRSSPGAMRQLGECRVCPRSGKPQMRGEKGAGGTESSLFLPLWGSLCLLPTCAVGGTGLLLVRAYN